MQSSGTSELNPRNRTRNLALLLFFVVVLQFGYPVTFYGSLWTAMYMVLYGGVIYFGIAIVRDDRRRMIPVMALGIIFGGFGTWFTIAQDRPSTVGMLISVALFMLALMLSLSRFIFRSGQVGMDMIIAAVTVYLIMGGFFGAAFAAFEIGNPGSFTDPQVDGSLKWQQLLYFSYVTMATLGYGEIVPITAWARSMASLEAVVGTLFLTIVIARLVGVWTGTRRRDHQPEHAPGRD